MFSVYGIERLEMDARKHMPEGSLDWLRRGFERVNDPARVMEWHSAFPPLEMRLESSAIGQLAAAIRDGTQAGMKWPERLKEEIDEYLEDPRSADPGQADFATAVWRLCAATEPRTNVAWRARSFLDALLEREPRYDRDVMADLVQAVVTAVAAAPPSQLQLYFFSDYLFEKPALWDDGFLLLVLNRQLSGTAAERAKEWLALRRHYGDALRRVADPATGRGRSVLRSLARQLGPALGFEAAPAAAADLEDIARKIGLFEAPRPARTETFRSRGVETAPHLASLLRAD